MSTEHTTQNPNSQSVLQLYIKNITSVLFYNYNDDVWMKWSSNRLRVVNPQADGLLQVVIWWGGRFGPPLYLPYYSPKPVLNGTIRLILTFSYFLVFVCFIMTSSGVYDSHSTKIYVSKIRNFEFFKIHFFAKNDEKSQNFHFCTIPMCFRGLQARNLKISKFSKNFFWDAPP